MRPNPTRSGVIRWEHGAPHYAPARSGDVTHSLADIRLAQKSLKYVPTVGFEDGLRRTVGWYRDASAADIGSATLVSCQIQ